MEYILSMVIASTLLPWQLIGVNAWFNMAKQSLSSRLFKNACGRSFFIMQIDYIAARSNMQNVIKIMAYNIATQKIFMSVLYSTDKITIILTRKKHSISSIHVCNNINQKPVWNVISKRSHDK